MSRPSGEAPPPPTAKRALDRAARRLLKQPGMRTTLTLLLPLLLAAGCDGPDQSKLNGTWTYTSSTGESETFQFHPDGTYDQDDVSPSQTTHASGKWQLEIGGLHLDTTVDGAVIEQYLPAAIVDGDQFIPAPLVAQNPPNGVVGTWLSSSELRTGLPGVTSPPVGDPHYIPDETLVLASDGTFTASGVVVPPVRAAGTWKQSGDQLTLTGSAGPDRTLTFYQGHLLVEAIFHKQK
jgi:hypothetical protein